MQRITQGDLLQYIYGESSTEQIIAIELALQTDWNLKQQYNLLLDAKLNAPEILLSPRQNSVDSILNYAATKVAIKEIS